MSFPPVSHVGVRLMWSHYINEMLTWPSACLRADAHEQWFPLLVLCKDITKVENDPNPCSQRLRRPQYVELCLILCNKTYLKALLHSLIMLVVFIFRHVYLHLELPKTSHISQHTFKQIPDTIPEVIVLYGCVHCTGAKRHKDMQLKTNVLKWLWTLISLLASSWWTYWAFIS